MENLKYGKTRIEFFNMKCLFLWAIIIAKRIPITVSFQRIL